MKRSLPTVLLTISIALRRFCPGDVPTAPNPAVGGFQVPGTDGSNDHACHAHPQARGRITASLTNSVHRQEYSPPNFVHDEASGTRDHFMCSTGPGHARRCRRSKRGHNPTPGHEANDAIPTRRPHQMKAERRGIHRRFVSKDAELGETPAMPKDAGPKTRYCRSTGNRYRARSGNDHWILITPVIGHELIRRSESKAKSRKHAAGIEYACGPLSGCLSAEVVCDPVF